jgi:hypothetical protein
MSLSSAARRSLSAIR